ncbi:hypothetical protein EC988_009871, partial [Linderina pennispora]
SKSASLLQTLMGRPSGVSSPVNGPEADSKLLALSKLMQQNGISGTPPPPPPPPTSSLVGPAAVPHVLADGSGFIQGSMMPMPMVAPFVGSMMAPHPGMHPFGMVPVSHGFVAPMGTPPQQPMPPHANGSSALSGFAFDSGAIMNAYGNPKQ